MVRILGTTFLDRNVKAILPPQGDIFFHHAPYVALTGMNPSKHERLIASRSTARKQEPANTIRKKAPFATNTTSGNVRLFKGFTTPPMTQAPIRTATTVGGLCFLQNKPCTAHKNLYQFAQVVREVIVDQTFSVVLSNFGHRSVHIPKHTVIRLALPSPTHILTLSQSALGAVGAKEGVGVGILNSGNIYSSTAREVSSTGPEDQTA